MTLAINLNEQSMRILWPATPGRRRPSGGGGSNHPSVSAAAEFQLTLPENEVGPFNARYVRAKLIFGGSAKLKAPLLNGGAPAPNQLGLSAERRADGTAAIAAKYEREIREGITAEMGVELSSDNFNEVSEHIAAGNWSAAMRSMFNMKIKGGIPLTQSGSSGLDLEFDIAPDRHLCFFGATGKLKVALPLDNVRGLDLPRGYTVELESTNTIRFGLTEEGWRRVAQAVGGPAIRAACAQVGRAAARQAMMTALRGAGIWTVAIVGTLGITYLSVEMCNAAQSEGARLGMLTPYCLGYVSRLQFAHTRGVRERSAVRSYVNQSRRRKLGWDDCSRAMTAGGLRQVERTMIRHFGSDFDINVFESIANWDQRVGNVRSRVGTSIDDRGEMRQIANNMADYLASNIDSVVGYLGRARAGGFIRSANAASRR